MEEIETRKNKLGGDHPDTLATMNNIAFMWKGQGRNTEAIKLMSERMRLRRRILGAT